jgi:hypothetical protein
MSTVPEATGLAISADDVLTEEFTGATDGIGSMIIEVAVGRRRDDREFHTRRMTVTEFGDRFLSGFERGPKDGRCILQGSLVSTQRLSRNVKANYLVMLDHDSGETMDEIAARYEDAGLVAALWNTHSHLSTETEIGQDALDRHIKKNSLNGTTPEGMIAAVRHYLETEKGVVNGILQSVTDVKVDHREGGVKYVVSHDPMHKVRSLTILAVPFEFAVTGVSQKDRIEEWKRRYIGFAKRLGVIPDEKCKDPARLMYTPRIRREADENCYEIRFIDGRCVKLDDMPLPVEETPTKRAVTHLPKQRAVVQVPAVSRGTGTNTFRTSGLSRFLAASGKSFQAAQWLASVTEVRADKGEGKIECECPLDDMHSNPGDPADRGFFAADCDPDSGKSWTMHCCHATCSSHAGADRAQYLDAACVKYGIKDANELSAWCSASDSADGEPNWTRDGHGRPKPNHSGNLDLALNALGVRVWFDEFLFAEMISGLGVPFDGEQTDAAITELRYRIEDRFGFLPSKDAFFDWLARRTWQSQRNVAREYFEALPAWDGTVRLDTWLITYCGADDTPINRVFGRVWLVGAITRAMSPGSKFDHMLILEGEQGVGKSMTVRTLCPFEDWFTDSIDMLADSKVMMEQCRGKFLVECAELAGMRKADVDAVKANLTRQADEARLAYARKKTVWKRTCAFVGTTNSPHYLKDDTGNRRFFPVRVTKADLEALRADRAQIWAEALTAYRAGEKPVLPFEYRKAAAEVQAERVAADPIYETLLPLLGDRAGWIVKKDVYEKLGIDIQNNAACQRAGVAMRLLGFQAEKHRIDLDDRGEKRPTAAFVRAPSDWDRITALTYQTVKGAKVALPRIKLNSGPELGGIPLDDQCKAVDGVRFVDGKFAPDDTRSETDKAVDALQSELGLPL